MGKARKNLEKDSGLLAKQNEMEKQAIKRQEIQKAQDLEEMKAKFAVEKKLLQAERDKFAKEESLIQARIKLQSVMEKDP